MIGMGTIINAALTLVGGALGFLFGKALKERYQNIMIAGCGLSTIFIGAGGTLKQMFTLTDGVIDFERAVRDEKNPRAFDAACDRGDHLHASVEGYRRMAEAVDLGIFR